MDTFEKELLKKLVNSHKDAIEHIYTHYYPVIQSLIINNNGSVEDAQDVFQEAMIVLYENAKREDFNLTSQLRTYLYAICKRLWLKRLQQQYKYNVVLPYDSEDLTDIHPSIEEYKKRESDFGIVQAALQRVGEPCKGLLEACYIHNKNMKEIATVFGYTNADNAKNQKYKCLMRLKKLFFEKYKG